MINRTEIKHEQTPVFDKVAWRNASQLSIYGILHDSFITKHYKAIQNLQYIKKQYLYLLLSWLFKNSSCINIVTPRTGCLTSNPSDRSFVFFKAHNGAFVKGSKNQPCGVRYILAAPGPCVYWTAVNTQKLLFKLVASLDSITGSMSSRFVVRVPS